MQSQSQGASFGPAPRPGQRYCTVHVPKSTWFSCTLDVPYCAVCDVHSAHITNDIIIARKSQNLDLSFVQKPKAQNCKRRALAVWARTVLGRPDTWIRDCIVELEESTIRSRYRCQFAQGSQGFALNPHTVSPRYEYDECLTVSCCNNILIIRTSIIRTIDYPKRLARRFG